MLHSKLNLLFQDTAKEPMLWQRKQTKDNLPLDDETADYNFIKNTQQGQGNQSGYMNRDTKRKLNQAKAKARRYLIGFSLLCLLCLLVWMYHTVLKPMIRQFHNPNDALYNEGIPTYYVDLHNYIDGEPRYNIYKDWQEYNSTWHKCLEISHVNYLLKPEHSHTHKLNHYKHLLESLGIIQEDEETTYATGDPKDDISNYYLYTHPLTHSTNFVASEYYNYQDLVIAQLMHTRGKTTADIRVGNFTVPPMYMSTESTIVVHESPVAKAFAVFPCVCTLLLHNDPESRDINLRKVFKSDVIHMVNLKLNGEQQTSYSAQITITMVRSMNKLFEMEIPSHLNVTFSSFNFGERKLVKHNIVFYEPVNIVNLLNCVYFNDVKVNKKWRISSKKI